MKASRGSLKALDWANLFMADVKDGVGVYLSVFLMLIAFMLLPVRAILFAFLDDPYILTAIQILDGIGAGIFGVVSILMIADLSQGTGRFNLLQGFVYSAIGLAASISSVIGGLIVKWGGYPAGFGSLAGLGIIGLLFFWKFVPETLAVPNKKEEQATPSRN